MPVKFIQAPDAVATTKHVAQPGLLPAAQAVERTIPNFVPVHHGVMKRNYNPSLKTAPDSVQVYLGSPFWHWLEYGTRFNAAYRVVENAVRSLGLRFEPK